MPSRAPLRPGSAPLQRFRVVDVFPKNSSVEVYGQIHPSTRQAEFSEPHTHEFLEVAVVGEGFGAHRTAAGSSALEPGVVLITRPGSWHTHRTDSERLTLATAYITMSVLREDLSYLRSDPVLHELLWAGPMAKGRHGVLEARIDTGLAAEVVHEIEELQRIVDARPTARLAILARVVVVLGLIADGVGHPTQRPATHTAVMSTIDRLEADPAHPWSLGDLARLVNLDPAYLTRLFDAHLGVPPLSYLARVRAEHAASLLSTTSLAIQRIGEEVGWPDATYFARRFKSLTGLTPSAYRSYRSPALMRTDSGLR